MYSSNPLLREDLKTAHAASWAELAEPGAFLTGAQRIAAVGEARAALDCPLCRKRKAALSPFASSFAAADTGHTRHAGGAGVLNEPLIDVIHRLRTDPGRLTRAWFDEILATGVAAETYVEVVSVVTTSVIVDTLHQSLGLVVPELPEPIAGDPTGERNPNPVDGGAWVPIMKADQDLSETGLPTVPNIARAMGLVPTAVALSFRTFRPHYQLMNIKLSISQAQTEFIASRVSSLNECFY
jgi:hypothetical protein